MTTRRRGVRDEAGYAAILVALLLPTVFVGLAALAVDVSRWYAEIARVQKAADAAAMAGVTYMPTDFDMAEETALGVAADNGYPEGELTSITVAEGARPSQLRVTISTHVDNSFGAALGIDTAQITETAVADYTAPAPMGSPCNTFGNEPASNSKAAPPVGSALPTPPFVNCTSTPHFWAAIAGVQTDKVNGDRFMTTPCSSGTFGCTSGRNVERRPEGYFWAIHVEPEAVGQSIEVQVYDPAYIETGTTCGDLSGLTTNGINEYAPDASSRYAGSGNTFCPGDYGYGTASSTPAPDTTFLVREQTDTGDPMKGAVIPQCTKQFRGVQRTPTLTGATGTPPTAALSQWTNPPANTTTRARYNPELTRLFHQWVSLCTFSAQRSGDYFLQVRTNVSLGGTPTANTNAAGVTYDPMVYSGKSTAGNASGDTTAGFGLNAFALRALPSSASFRDDIAVAGYSRMPIYQNSPGSTASFNLVRALPGTRGQYVTFDFFDAADATGSGTVKVVPPADATWDGRSGTDILGCRSAINSAAYVGLPATCSTSVSSSANNGKVHHLIIPIPPTYNCDASTLGGCWFKVQITFPGATSVTDFTTWVANIGGDPVRLIE